ncbi:hypothetical protein [Caballeronia sp. S22]|uniref:hypothetical protein n=1 Tax=Caballeronia sp. S22 TaxID=3137182 RepID=UPI00353094C9
MKKILFVISDLHIGGAYSVPSDPTGRGFRLCTHVDVLASFVRALIMGRSKTTEKIELVVNGDFLDFLAEERGVDQEDPETGTKWSPLFNKPVDAAKTLARMIDRDQNLFDSLRNFLGAGHRLTLLLGNHDIELSYPSVRRLLITSLDADGKDFQFIYDGEAYAAGNVLIEHGNRYDEWNVVSHDFLRRERSIQSRNENTPDIEQIFEAPAGSYLVAGVMNLIKERYPFIDLLKPEGEAAVPILLALAPEYRRHVIEIAGLLCRSRKHRIGKNGLPSFAADISDHGELAFDGEQLVQQILRKRLSSEDVEALYSGAAGVPDFDVDVDISDVGSNVLWSKIKLLTVSPFQGLEERLQTLSHVLQAAKGDFSFDTNAESEQYVTAAKRLLKSNFELVIFGHTHLAKDITFEVGRYINTGTWADLISLPKILTGIWDAEDRENKQTEFLNNVRIFVEDMRTSRLKQYLRFRPTYARVALDEAGHLIEAGLFEYSGEERIS